jgi:hypothetical protein
MCAAKDQILFAAEGFSCVIVQKAGWSGKENGELLDLAEQDYDLLVTVDKNIRYQQKLKRTRNLYPGHPIAF